MRTCTRCGHRAPVLVPRRTARHQLEWLCEYCDGDDRQTPETQTSLQEMVDEQARRRSEADTDK